MFELVVAVPEDGEAYIIDSFSGPWFTTGVGDPD